MSAYTPPQDEDYDGVNCEGEECPHPEHVNGRLFAEHNGRLTWCDSDPDCDGHGGGW